jgi:uncharacterized protein (DUF2141 family)
MRPGPLIPLALLLAPALAAAADATAAAASADATAPATATASAPAGAELTVAVTALHSAQGHLCMALFSQPDGFPESKTLAHATARVAITAAPDGTGTATVVFPGLPPGTYAVTCFHDENDNDTFDKSWLGVPREGWAVSNNVVPHLRAPTWDEARFTLGPTAQTIAVKVHY